MSESSEIRLLAVLGPGPDGTRRVLTIVPSLSQARAFAAGYAHGPGRGADLGIRAVRWELDPAAEEEEPILGDLELTE